MRRNQIVLIILQLVMGWLYGSEADFTWGGKLTPPGLEIGYFQKGDKFNLFGCFYTKPLNKTFPCVVKFGNVSAGGSLSVLKNPLLLAPSAPFGGNKKSAGGITGTPATSSSFSGVMGELVQTGYVSKKLNLTGNFYINEELLKAASFVVEGKLSNQLKLNFSETFCSFPCNERSYSSWFDWKNFYFHQDELCSNLMEFSLSSKSFSSIFMIGSYETPFGNWTSLFRSEAFLKIRPFVFTFSGFYNPEEKLFLPSENFLNSRLQFKTSLTYNTHCCNSLVKAGFSGLINFQPHQELPSGKALLGLQLNNPFMMIQPVFSINFDFDDDLHLHIPSASFSLKNNFYIKNATLYAAASWSFPELTNLSNLDQRYNLNFYAGKQLKFSLTNSFGFTVKEGSLKSKNYSYGLSFSGKYKWIYVYLKLKGKVDL